MIKYILCVIFLFVTSYSIAEDEYHSDFADRLRALESEVAKVSSDLNDVVSRGDAKNQESYSTLYTKITDIEERLRELNGKFQHVEYTSKQLVAKLANLTEDMNYRFTKLERDRNSKEKIHSLKDGVKLFEEGRYKDARESFNSYIKVAQGNEKGEAYYWLGKCYMEDNINKEAGTYFLKSYKYYPANSRAADSLLNLAVSLKKLDKRNRACSILERLDMEYPNRPEDQKELSKQEQDSLKCG